MFKLGESNKSTDLRISTNLKQDKQKRKSYQGITQSNSQKLVEKKKIFNKNSVQKDTS